MVAPLATLPEVQGAIIFADAGDGMLELRSDWTEPTIHNTDDWNANIGEWFGPGLTTAVIPFELPDFGVMNDPFLTASFGVNLFEIGNDTVTDLDLYAVRVDASPLIAASDWYHGSLPDPTATLLQAGFLTPTSSTDSADPASGPNNATNAEGNANLLIYLNSAYDGGQGAGQFVFLRVSYGADDFADAWDAYKFTTRNAGLEGDWPVIEYTAIPEPSTYAIFVGLGALGLAALRRSKGGR